MENNFVIEFDYNLEALNELKSTYLQINKEDIEEVTEATKELVKIRRNIEAKGKTYRDEANAFNKKVLTKQKEYIGIIEPLETEFKDILKKEEERQALEARKEMLPNRKNQLSLLKITQPTDEEILAIEDKDWLEFYNQKFAEHEDAVKKEEEAKIEAERQKEREEQIKKEAEERAKKDAEEALKRAEAEKEAEIAKIKQGQEDKERKEKEAEEARKQAEEAERKKTEANKKYQVWLKENGYTAENKDDFHIENKTDVVILYKKVGIFTK